MKVTEGEKLGVTGYKLYYRDGSTVVIDREPNEFEVKECLIEAIDAPTPPAQEDESKRKVVDEYSLEFHLQKHGIPCAPQERPDKLRKAAEEALPLLDLLVCKYSLDADDYASLQKLRAALEGE